MLKVAQQLQPVPPLPYVPSASHALNIPQTSNKLTFLVAVMINPLAFVFVNNLATHLHTAKRKSSAFATLEIYTVADEFPQRWSYSYIYMSVCV